MNEIGFLILLIFLSYIAGSFPTSIIMGQVTKDIDIRDHGSGNAGATNAFCAREAVAIRTGSGKSLILSNLWTYG